MKSKLPRKTASAAPAAKTQPSSQPSYWWAYLLGMFLAAFAAFQVYGSTLRAPFLFDDLYLPFTIPDFADEGFRTWVRGMRPLLMATYWLNFQTSGQNPYAYHVWNVLFHVAAAAMAWLIVRNLLGRAGEAGWKRETLAAFAGAVFLLHPLQTESVAYVASRSESLSVLLAYAALAAFLLHEGGEIGWGRTFLILGLFGAAALSKEHTAVMPAAILLADMFWMRRSVFQSFTRQWRLFGLLAIGGLFGLSFVWKVLVSSASAGFHLKEITWYQYFWTQCRAIWVYIRMFFLPYGQNIDHDFAVSRSPFEHGAWIGFLALVALAALAWIWRERLPLASFGVFLFLLLIAPTSSVVPLLDTLVERRVYLPMVGLLLVVCEAVRRAPLSRWQLTGVLSAVAIVLAVLTMNRNQVWTDPITLWTDSVTKAPRKVRPRHQLAFAYFEAGQCERAAAEYEKAAKLAPPDKHLLINWALAWDCAQRYDAALDRLKQALALERSAHVHSLLGMIQAKRGRYPEAWAEIEAALRLDSNFAMAYVYRGNLRVIGGDIQAAIADYRKALELEPGLEAAQQALAQAEQRLAAPAR